MSRQYQDPSFLSSHYQTPYPHPSEAPTENPAQSIQPQPLGQPIPITRDSSSQHGIVSPDLVILVDLCFLFKLTHFQVIKKAHCSPSRRDDAKVVIHLTLRFPSQAALLATKHTLPTLRQHRISPGAHIDGIIRVNMTIFHPFLKAVSLIHQAVRILAPATSVTRILEATTLRKQRNLRMRDMPKSTIVGNVPGILLEAIMLRNLRMLEILKSTIIGHLTGILL